MGEIVEVEGGLFTRRGVTRALCDLGPLFYLAMVSAGASWSAASILWMWRRCDRCRRKLFSHESASYRLLGVRGFGERPPRDYRAAQFAGSYLYGALLSTAIKGRLHCQWCGHLDGAKPDYVVTSNE